MTARNYDVILKIANVDSFVSSTTIVGNTTRTVGYIAGIDTNNLTLKVKLANILEEFSSTEYIHSNTTLLTGTANGALNSTSLPFQANVMSGNTTTAVSLISSISPSTFIAEKNAFTQNPIVRLYSVYFPGEWYPPNEYGNPTGQGEGRAWPMYFPIRFAEIIGDLNSDISYNVSYGGVNFVPYPVNVSGLEQGSDGKINELTITMFNADNLISRLVEDPYLSGNNISNSVLAIVNGEYVHGIDPRTVNASVSDFSVDSEQYISLLRARQQGLDYNPGIVAAYGGDNVAFSKEQTDSVGGVWQAQKMDTRDMLGGVVEIKTTFANFLDYWPEYSSIQTIDTNAISVVSALPYRVGDTVYGSNILANSTIVAINNNDTIYLANTITDVAVSGPLYIHNEQADKESFIEDKYKIDQLEGLTDEVATFGLISWLQYFKVVTPRRKYYKNTCQWQYKGEECQYPGPGGHNIPGTSEVSPAYGIAANNAIMPSTAGDVCAKSFAACALRKNTLHFGAFPGVGRSVAKM